MPTKSSAGVEDAPSYLAMVEGGGENGPQRRPGASSVPGWDVPAFPLPNAQGSQKAHMLRLWITLLVVVCLGCLGSLSLVPYTLPGITHSTKTTTQVHVRPTTTIALATPGSSSNTGGGGCTANPQNMKYLSTIKIDDKTLPPAWLQAERNAKDLSNAQACAAIFILAYQTFDATHLQLLEVSTSMMSSGARQRFYGKASNTQADERMDPMWRASIQKQQIQQVAQVGEPDLLSSLYTNGKLLVWMKVPCQISLRIAGSQPVIENTQFTVLLVSAPVSAQGQETGWQVSQWQEGSIVFKPPTIL